MHRNRATNPDWQRVGDGLGGTLGVPTFIGHGALSPGETIHLALTGMAPGAVTNLVAGLSAIDAPFKGGTLTPFPDLIVPFAADVTGLAVLEAAWPPGVPAGVSIWLQHWLADGGAPNGFAASPALRGTTQP